MNDWLYKKENFEPIKSKNSYIEKSIKAFEKVLLKFKHINIGEKFKYIYFQNPLIKSVITLMIIIITSFTHDYFGMIYITLWILNFLFLMERKDVYKCLSISLIVFLGNFIVLIPAILSKNYHSIFIIAKSILMVLTINIYVFSTKWNHITRVLKFFKIPDIFIFLLDITLKYIISFSEFSIEMLNALKVRVIGKTNYNGTGIIGTLFLKSKEQSEELYFAMECRGFSGEYIGFENFKVQNKDKKQILIGLVFLIGDIFIEMMVKYF